MKILILGANGFIGSHLSEAILSHTEWEIVAMDLAQDKLSASLSHPRFHFYLGDMTQETQWLIHQISECDLVIPLVAIATPAIYVQNPLRVFELDFEENLKVIRECVRFKKRIIFPSTSEVYGMCPDHEFDEEKSPLVTGPIHKERWIYSTSKQLLDRIIYAYGKHERLNYTLFRPFNWYGPRLDNIFNPKPGGSRVLSQFIGNILRGEEIILVNGGLQRRSFAYIDDCIKALLKIIENQDQCAYQRIFNIGNPNENLSIRALAESLIELIKQYPAYTKKAEDVKLIEVDAKEYYGEGYQDVQFRTPSIQKAAEYLHWAPETPLSLGLQKTLDYYLKELS
jgi:nucleoside-diphosphate-sugar epimerase